jgi:hypothetical protein
MRSSAVVERREDERTLEAAERVGAQNAYVQRARQSLERKKQILLEGGAGESAGGEDGKAARLAGSPSEPPS